MSNILFVHNGSSGRFDFLGEALHRRGHSCVLINDSKGNDIPHAPTRRWQLSRGATEGIFRPTARVESDFLRGRAAAECAVQFKADGFQPDLIIGHPGWGEMLFLGEVFPSVAQIQVGEFYNRSRGSAVDFDPELNQLLTLDAQVHTHARNACFALSYSEAARIVVPTQFQASVIPEVFHSRIRIIHEGVDTDKVRAQPNPTVTLRHKGRVLDRTTPVVTFINRHFEPLRGFHVFMRALPRLLAAVPDAQVFLIGSDARAGYGSQPKAEGKETTWKQVMLQEVGRQLDLERVHFTGSLQHQELLTILSLSRAHVYLTYPFVLSWSLLDAMACECLIIGSDTTPVREVIRSGENGLLVNFFDHDALASALIEACVNPDQYTALRRAARATVVGEFDRKTKCEPAWLALIDEVLR